MIQHSVVIVKVAVTLRRGQKGDFYKKKIVFFSECMKLRSTDKCEKCTFLDVFVFFLETICSKVTKLGIVVV